MNAKTNPQAKRNGRKARMTFTAVVAGLKNEIDTLKRLLGRIMKALREIKRLLGEQNAKMDHLIRESREIRNLVLGREADGMPKVNLKGVRRDQFFAAVDCQHRNRLLSPWKCALAACTEIKATDENGGFDEDSLYRYMRSKPRYFRWTSGKNAGK